MAKRNLTVTNIEAKVAEYVTEKLPTVPFNEIVSEEQIEQANMPDFRTYVSSFKIPTMLRHLTFIIVFCLTGEAFRAKPESDRLVKTKSLTCLQYIYNYFKERGFPEFLPERLRNYLRMQRGLVMIGGKFQIMEDEHLGIMILGFLAFKYPTILENKCKGLRDVAKTLRVYCLPEIDWKKKVEGMLHRRFPKESPAAQIRVHFKLFHRLVKQI